MYSVPPDGEEMTLIRGGVCERGSEERQTKWLTILAVVAQYSIPQLGGLYRGVCDIRAP